jgi:hypothetical protein
MAVAGAFAFWPSGTVQEFARDQLLPAFCCWVLGGRCTSFLFRFFFSFSKVSRLSRLASSRSASNWGSPSPFVVTFRAELLSPIARKIVGRPCVKKNN